MTDRFHSCVMRKRYQDKGEAVVALVLSSFWVPTSTISNTSGVRIWIWVEYCQLLLHNGSRIWLSMRILTQSDSCCDHTRDISNIEIAESHHHCDCLKRTGAQESLFPVGYSIWEYLHSRKIEDSSLRFHRRLSSVQDRKFEDYQILESIHWFDTYHCYMYECTLWWAPFSPSACYRGQEAGDWD